MVVVVPAAGDVYPAGFDPFLHLEVCHFPGVHDGHVLLPPQQVLLLRFLPQPAFLGSYQ